MALCHNCVSRLTDENIAGRVRCCHPGVAQEGELSCIYTARKVYEGQGYVLVLPRLICGYHSFIPIRKPEPKLVRCPVNWLEYKEVYDANSSSV